ncbi:MAG: hypothetical protein JRI68_05080 [Deltaproteobacteria bacterium]|nr:hypothetical protein [Deltaproteobacteria bacterium]
MSVGLAEIILLTVLGTLGGGSSLLHSQPLLWLGVSVSVSSAPMAGGAAWWLLRSSPYHPPPPHPIPHRTLPPPVPPPPPPPQIPTP